MKYLQNFSWSTFIQFSMMLAIGCMIVSCGDEDPDPGPGGSGGKTGAVTAAFSTGNQDALTVTFVNASINADNYEWDFGDTNSSTEESPTHTYAADGTYTVTLTASNDDNNDSATAEVTVKTPVFGNHIVGKTWIIARGEAISYHLGPDDIDPDPDMINWSYSSTVPAPWFNIGDIQDDAGTFLCQNSLSQRPSIANDEYTFNADGTYNINWNGDFWGEYGIWEGTAFNEVDIELTGGSLPARADGVDVSAFVNETQSFVIDEVAGTLQVIGEGAHIHNPRYKTGQSSHDVGNGITYTIHHIGSSADADTLVLENRTFDNDFSANNKHYITLCSYKGTVPAIKDNSGGFVPVDFAPEVSSSDIWEVMDMEGNWGSGVDEWTSSSTVTKGVMMGGELCMQYDRTEADGGFTDYKLWSRDADIRFDDAGSPGNMIASVDVFIPSSNDFSGALANQVEVILADESGDDDGGEGGPGFWCCWALLSQENIATDEWVTLTFDFTGQLEDSNAANGYRDDIDLVILRMGGSGHPEAGTFFAKDFKFIR